MTAQKTAELVELWAVQPFKLPRMCPENLPSAVRARRLFATFHSGHVYPGKEGLAQMGDDFREQV